MWSGSKNKEANWEVMKFWSSPEGSKIAHVMRVAASPCPQVWKDHGDDKDPIMGVFLQEGFRPTFQPPYTISSYFWQCTGPNFQDIWTRYLELKERPLEKIVKDAADKSQKCLDDKYAKEKT